jgi:hypothetical protein
MNEQELLTRSKITELSESIKQTKNEIEELRKACPHTTSTIQLLDGGKQVCKVCIVCDEVTGYATPQELDIYLKN